MTAVSPSPIKRCLIVKFPLRLGTFGELVTNEFTDIVFAGDTLLKCVPF